MIKVYALSTCPWCKKVKNFFAEKGIACDVIDVDLIKGEEQKEALREVDRLTGKRSFPITVINEKVIVGYKPEELEEALKNEG